jgi:cold-inducible RNA-binding protein
MGRRLFVGNLNFSTTSDDLKELFTEVGPCESAEVMIDRATGRSRGFAFVEMGSDEAAVKAVEVMNNNNFQGRPLKVNEARERTPGGGGPRGDRPSRPYSPRPDFGNDFGGGGDGFGGGFAGGGGGGAGGRGGFKPRKEGGSRRGLRARKRSL